MPWVENDLSVRRPRNLKLKSFSTPASFFYFFHKDIEQGSLLTSVLQLTREGTLV